MFPPVADATSASGDAQRGGAAHDLRRAAEVDVDLPAPVLRRAQDDQGRQPVPGRVDALALPDVEAAPGARDVPRHRSGARERAQEGAQGLAAAQRDRGAERRSRLRRLRQLGRTPTRGPRRRPADSFGAASVRSVLRSALEADPASPDPPPSTSWGRATPRATTAAAATSPEARARRRREAGEGRGTTGAGAPARARGGELRQDGVEAGGDVGGDRTGVPCLGEAGADGRLLGGGQVVGHRVTSSGGRRGVGAGCGADGSGTGTPQRPPPGGARGVPVDGTSVPGPGFPAGRAGEAGLSSPSRGARRARPREHRDFTVPSAHSRIAAASATE